MIRRQGAPATPQVYSFPCLHFTVKQNNPAKLGLISLIHVVFPTLLVNTSNILLKMEYVLKYNVCLADVRNP